MKNFTLFFFLISNIAFTQTPVVIDIDLKSKSPISSLPFDRPLILKMKPPGDYIYGVGIMELRKCNKWKFNKSLPQYKNDNSFEVFKNEWLIENGYSKIPEIPEKNFSYNYWEVKEKEPKSNEKEFLIRIEGIEKFYKEIKSDVNDQKTRAEVQYGKTKVTSKLTTTQKAENPFSQNTISERFYLKPNSKYILFIRKEGDFKIEGLNDATYRNKLLVKLKTEKEIKNFNEWYDRYNNLNSIVNQKIGYNYSIPSNLFKIKIEPIVDADVKRGLAKVIELHAYTRKTDEFSGRIDKIFKDSSFIKVVSRINTLTLSDLPEIARGKDLIDEFGYFLPNEKKETLFLNLSRNIEKLKNLKYIVDYFSNIVKIDGKEKLDDFVSALSSLLNEQKEILDKTQKLRTLIFQGNYGDNNTVKQIVDSETIDFETRSKFAITPEFGFISAKLNRGTINGNPEKTDPKAHLSPYMGFHINFRYWDKNIPFWHNPNHKLINHGSLMVGYTLNKIDSKTNADFFASGRSLLLGFGFRLGNVARIIGGTMLSNQVNSTKTTANGFDIVKQDVVQRVENGVTITTTTTSSIPNTGNTTITDRTPKATLFLGISLDLSLKPFLNTDFSDFNPLKIFKSSSNGTPR